MTAAVVTIEVAVYNLVVGGTVGIGWTEVWLYSGAGYSCSSRFGACCGDSRRRVGIGRAVLYNR